MTTGAQRVPRGMLSQQNLFHCGNQATFCMPFFMPNAFRQPLNRILPILLVERIAKRSVCECFAFRGCHVFHFQPLRLGIPHFSSLSLSQRNGSKGQVFCMNPASFLENASYFSISCQHCLRKGKGKGKGRGSSSFLSAFEESWSLCQFYKSLSNLLGDF